MRNIKKLSSGLVFLLLANMLLSTLAIADAKKGHRLYKKKLQKSCKSPGSIFARNHTQDEWEKIYEDGFFKEETKTICPQLNIEKLNEKQWADLYDFTYKYGIGGEIPNGCDPK